MRGKMRGKMKGSIIAGMRLKNAVLLGYETRVHRRKVMKMEYSWAENADVEKVNQKVHLAQYCALAACGHRSFSKDIHGELLKEVTSLLSLGFKESLTGDEAAKFLEQTIRDKVMAVDKKDRSAMLEVVCNSGFILGLSERNADGRMVPVLKGLDEGKILEDADYFAFGVEPEEAKRVMKKGYRKNMSVKQGIDLMVEAIKAAFLKDKDIILGGHIEVLVLGCRDIEVLPLSRGEQMLDRNITFFRMEELPKRRVRPIPQEQELPKKRQRSTGKQEQQQRKR